MFETSADANKWASAYQNMLDYEGQGGGTIVSSTKIIKGTTTIVSQWKPATSGGGYYLSRKAVTTPTTTETMYTIVPGGPAADHESGDFASDVGDGLLTQDVLGFINIDKFATIEGSRPDYRGVFIHATYYPSGTEKYSSYNWIFLEQTDHGSFIRTDPNNLVNHGPHFFGEAGSLSIWDNSMYDASEYPTMNFTGTMTLYGIQGNTSTQIGTITYGYNYSNGILTPIEPVIDYIGR